MTRKITMFNVFFAIVLVACGKHNDAVSTHGTQGGGSNLPVSAGSSPGPSEHASPVDESARLRIDYKVLGNPVVGHPLAIRLELSSVERDTPVMLRYRINDASSMTFPESQANMVELPAEGDELTRVQEVTVIPQREGRVYLNVSAETRSSGDSMLKSMAIPILVDAAPASGDSADDGGADQAALPQKQGERR